MKTDRQLIERLLELQEHPEQVTDEQLQQVLDDPQRRELVEQMAFAKRAFKNEELQAEELDVDGEWEKFLAQPHSSLFTHHFSLYVGNDGLPIPAENRQSLFVPFFTTKRSGSGIGLSLSRRMMIQQGGMLDLAETPLHGCHAAFVLSLQV